MDYKLFGKDFVFYPLSLNFSVREIDYLLNGSIQNNLLNDEYHI